MAEQEKSVRITRAAAKKRAASTMAVELQLFGKRVVLREVTNLTDVDHHLTPGFEPLKRKCKSKSEVNKPVTTCEIFADGDDPQLCAPYASDIYQYLRKMEVRGSSLSVT